MSSSASPAPSRRKTLLSLGVTNIVTGPTAPGFLTPDLLAVLNEKFGLRSVTNVEDDMKQLLSA